MGLLRFISTLSSTESTPKPGTRGADAAGLNASPHSGNETHRYTALSSEKAEIRLLHLLPGSGRSQIVVSIDTVPFGSNDHPRFEALSYTWGPEINQGLSYVHGTHGTLSVRPNLLEALYQLRYPQQSRCLWIDAICINQGDEAERSEQVKYMANVYLRATKVAVWIGAESPTSGLAVKSISTINQNIQVDWNQSNVTIGTKRKALTQRRAVDLKPKEMSALIDLLRRPYFKRLWVYQEIQLGGDRAMLVCGPDRISWQAVRNAVQFISQHNINATGDMSSSQWKYIHHLCDNYDSRRNFIAALHTSRLAECSDDRDRVFSALSMFSKGQSWGMATHNSSTLENGYSFILERGYLKPVSQVYTEVALMMLGQLNSLEFLHYVGQPKGCDLPSWVPDWSVNNPERAFNDVRASRNVRRLPYQLIHNHTIRVPCFIVGEIGFHSPLFELPQQYVCDILSGTPDGINYLDWVTRALYSNSFAENHLTSQLKNVDSYPSFFECRDKVLKSLRNRSRLIHTEITKSRSILLTKSGRIVLGPSNSQVGDQIGIFPSCTAPIILRPSSRSQGRYKVIGPAYVERYMEMEAWLGPMPKRVERLNVFRKDGSLDVMYSDHRRGKLLKEDPRLEKIELPAGWRRTSGGFENVQTGQTRIALLDPRFDVEFVRSKGLPLRDVELE